MTAYYKKIVKLFPLPNNRNDLFCLYLTAVTLSLYIILRVFKVQSFELNSFVGRIYGLAISEGIDTCKRQSLYFILLLIFTLSFSGIVSVLSNIFSTFSKRFNHDVITFEKAALIGIASMMCVTEILFLMYPSYRLQFYTFVELTLSICGILLIRWFFVLTHQKKLSTLLTLKPSAFGFYFLSLSVYLTIQFLLSSHHKLNTPVYIHWPLHTTPFFILGWLISILDKKHLFLKCCAPLLILPIAIIITGEAQYLMLLNDWQVCSKILFLYLLVPILLLCYCIYQYTTIKKEYISIKQNTLMKYWYFPVCLTTLTAMLFWHFQWTSRDLLHPANSITPAHGLMAFGQIPFINIWPTRGLWDYFFPTLFMLFGGQEQATSSFIWNVMPNKVIANLILYAVFTRFVRPGYALLLVLLLYPFSLFTTYDSLYYAMGLLPALFLPWVIKNFTFKRIVALWAITAFTFFWMPSIGKATILGTWIVLLIASLRRPQQIIRIVLPSFFLIFGSLGIIYAVLVSLHGGNVFDNIEWIRGFALCEFMNQGRIEFVNSITPLTIWYYVARPLLLISICILFSWRILSHQHIKPKQWIILGISVSMLFLLTRSLGRHTLAAGYMPLYSFLILALVPFLSPWKIRFYLPAWILFLGIILNVFQGEYTTAIPNHLSLPTMNWKSPVPERLSYTDTFKPLINILRSELSGNETFLDFLNGHGLYAASGKRNPLYLSILSLYNSDKGQKSLVKQLDQLFKKGDLPLVIMEGPASDSRIDYLPLNSQLYRVTEFTYQNYEPSINIGGFELWAAKDSCLSTMLPVCDTIDYLHIPIVNVHDYITQNASIRVRDNVLKIVGGPYDPFVYNLMSAAKIQPIPVYPNKWCLFSIDITNSHMGTFQLFFNFDDKGYNENNAVTFRIPAFEKPMTFQAMLPIPHDAQTLTDLRLDCPDNTHMEVHSMKLAMLDHANIPLTVSQIFETRQIPYLWAQYNKKHAITNQKLITLARNITLQKNITYDVPLPKYTSDSIAQYLDFSITSPVGGTITLYIKDTNDNVGQFSFNLKVSNKPVEYLVRISTLYAWIHKKTLSISVNTEVPITIHHVDVLTAD